MRCTKGAIFDVIVDIRPNSPTFKQWFGTQLNDTTRDSLCIPRGLAHGFVTLQDETGVAYLMSDFYVPGSDRGYRHDDPTFAISWSCQINNLSIKERNWPYLQDQLC